MEPSTVLDERTRTGRVAVMVAILLLFGCQSLVLDPRGRLVPQDKRMTIPDAGEQAGVYENEDLRLAFKMIRTPGQLQIFGNLGFADRISRNFPVVRTFHLGVMLLDDQGKILEMVNLISVSFYRTQYAIIPDYPLAFRRLVPLRENTRSIAFNYTGNAFDPTFDGGMMDFWEYPVY